jgi:hypothetical protein
MRLIQKWSMAPHNARSSTGTAAHFLTHNFPALDVFYHIKWCPALIPSSVAAGSVPLPVSHPADSGTKLPKAFKPHDIGKIP